MGRTRPVKPGPVAGRPRKAGLSVVAGNSPRAREEDHPSLWSRPRVRTLAIASGKGGVGKSNLAANLAVALGERGARVLLVDCDFAQANLDLLLGVHPRFDMSHVLRGEKTLEEIVVEGPAGVKLVPASSGDPELADLDDYRFEFVMRALGQLETDADLVLLDMASGISRAVTGFCLAANDVVVVATPELPSFSDAYALVKLLHAKGLKGAPHLMVSMSGTAEEAEETSHRVRLVARRFLRLELGAWAPVPYDSAIPAAVRRQEPVMTAFPKSPAAEAYRAIAARLWSPVVPDPNSDSHEELPHRLEA